MELYWPELKLYPNSSQENLDMNNGVIIPYRVRAPDVSGGNRSCPFTTYSRLNIDNFFLFILCFTNRWNNSESWRHGGYDYNLNSTIVVLFNSWTKEQMTRQTLISHPDHRATKRKKHWNYGIRLLGIILWTLFIITLIIILFRTAERAWLALMVHAFLLLFSLRRFFFFFFFTFKWSLCVCLNGGNWLFLLASDEHWEPSDCAECRPCVL